MKKVSCNRPVSGERLDDPSDAGIDRAQRADLIRLQLVDRGDLIALQTWQRRDVVRLVRHVCFVEARAACRCGHRRRIAGGGIAGAWGAGGAK